MRRVIWPGLIALTLTAAAVGGAGLPSPARAAPTPGKDAWREKGGTASLLVDVYGEKTDLAEDHAWEKAADAAARRLARQLKELEWVPTDDDLAVLKKMDDRVGEEPPGLEYRPDTGWAVRPEFLQKRLKAGEVVWKLEYDADAGRWKTADGSPPAELGADEKDPANHPRAYGNGHVFVRVSLTPANVQAVRDEANRLHHAADEVRQKQEAAVREVVVQARLLVAVKVLAALVVLALVVGGYLKLEEATRGYFTTLLRLAAAGVVILTAVGLTFLF
jgi:hypothetical protein